METDCSVEAVATMIGCFPTQALAFSSVSIQTQHTQRKRLRLGGNRAWEIYAVNCRELKLNVLFRNEAALWIYILDNHPAVTTLSRTLSTNYGWRSLLTLLKSPTVSAIIVTSFFLFCVSWLLDSGFLFCVVVIKFWCNLIRNAFCRDDVCRMLRDTAVS